MNGLGVVYPYVVDYYSQGQIDQKLGALTLYTDQQDQSNKTYVDVQLSTTSGVLNAKLLTASGNIISYVDSRDNYVLGQITTISGQIINWILAQSYVTPAQLSTTSGVLTAYVDTKVAGTTTSGNSKSFVYNDTFPKFAFTLPANYFVTSISTTVDQPFASAPDADLGGGSVMTDASLTIIRTSTLLTPGKLILQCTFRSRGVVVGPGTIKFKVARDNGGGSYTLTDISPTYTTAGWTSSAQSFLLTTPYQVPADGYNYYIAAYIVTSAISYGGTGSRAWISGEDVTGNRSGWSTTNDLPALNVSYSSTLTLGDLTSPASVSTFPLPASGTASDPIGNDPGPNSYDRNLYISLLGSPTTGSGSIYATYKSWNPPGVFVYGSNNITVSGGPAKWYVDGSTLTNLIATTSGYLRNFITTTSASLAAQAPSISISGTGGLIATHSGNVWYIDGSAFAPSINITGTGGIQVTQAGSNYTIDGSGISSNLTVSGITITGTGGIQVSQQGAVYTVDGSGVTGSGSNTGVVPTFTPSGVTLSGTVLQVQQAVKTDEWSSSTSSFIDVPGLSVTLQPKGINSKYLVNYSMHISANAANVLSHHRLVRNSIPIAIGDASGGKSRVTTGGTRALYDVNGGVTVSMDYVDSPGTSASGYNYKLQLWTEAATAYVNRPGGTLDTGTGYRTISTLTVTEIGTLVIPAVAQPVYNISGGGFNMASVGSGTFTANGATVAHGLNNPNHYLSITPITNDSNIAAKIGTIYATLGSNIDTVYSTGLSDAEGIPFQWMVTQSGSNNILTGTQASRPSAGMPRRLYLPTDGYYDAIDSGASWDVRAVPGFKCDNPPAANMFSQIHFSLSAGSASLVADGDGLLFSQTGNNSTTARDMSWAVQAIPASGAYKLIVGMETLISSVPYTQAGLVITDGNGGTPKGIEFILGSRLSNEYGSRIEIIYENNPTSFNSETWSYAPSTLGSRFFMRIDDDRTNLTYSYSVDGRSWIPAFAPVSRTSFLTPAYIGIHVGQQAVSGNGGAAVPTTLTRSYVKVFHWYLGI